MRATRARGQSSRVRRSASFADPSRVEKFGDILICKYASHYDRQSNFLLKSNGKNLHNTELSRLARAFAGNVETFTLGLGAGQRRTQLRTPGGEPRTRSIALA